MLGKFDKLFILERGEQLFKSVCVWGGNDLKEKRGVLAWR